MNKSIEDKLPKDQYSDFFLEGMKNRMMMSYYKYGDIKDAYPNKINALKSLLQRLEKYDTTGNTEFLIDAANFAMIEFMLPSHPKAHFKATDSEESPGRVFASGIALDLPNKAKYEYKKDGD